MGETGGLRPVNIADFEALAQAALDPLVWDFYAAGADDELTARENATAYRKIRLRPRFLIDIERIDTTTTVLGQEIGLPILIGPTNGQRLAHPDAELGMANAASAAGTIMVCSTMASYRIDELTATTDAPIWFQLYAGHSHAFTEHLVREAEAAGCRGLVVTIDTTGNERRERLIRRGGALTATWPREAWPANLHRTTFATPIFDAATLEYEDVRLTWKDVTWLRSLTTMPLLLKGVMTHEDAETALDYGVDGLIVSNHGGRMLDGTLPTIEALPEVVEAVGGKIDILVDGGVRRGTDVVKALALGAKAVLIGRPALWGLAVGGQAGVSQLLGILAAELEAAMAQIGCPTIASIDRSRIQRSPEDRHSCQSRT
jgi:isopentenyl diphosphate isomerase/L-lactate dehydrogenase-like FMN-dependent dehydrogenase